MKGKIVPILMFFTLPLFAQAPPQVPPGAIAVIDAQKVVQASEMGKKALAEIKAVKDKKQAEIDQRQDGIQTMQDKLDKQKDILSADAKDKLSSDISRSITDLRRYREDSENEIQNRLGTAIKSIEDRVLPIIQKIGTERGFAIILSKDQLVYYNPKFDITDEVIKAFNAQSGAAQAPAQKPQQ
jgi:outer membrane protein